MRDLTLKVAAVALAMLMVGLASAATTLLPSGDSTVAQGPIEIGEGAHCEGRYGPGTVQVEEGSTTNTYYCAAPQGDGHTIREWMGWADKDGSDANLPDGYTYPGYEEVYLIGCVGVGPDPDDRSRYIERCEFSNGTVEYWSVDDDCFDGSCGTSLKRIEYQLTDGELTLKDGSTTQECDVNRKGSGVSIDCEELDPDTVTQPTPPPPPEPVCTLAVYTIGGFASAPTGVHPCGSQVTITTPVPTAGNPDGNTNPWVAG